MTEYQQKDGKSIYDFGSGAISILENEIVKLKEQLELAHLDKANLATKVGELHFELNLMRASFMPIIKAVNAALESPYQLYVDRGYSGSYLVNKQEFENLQKSYDDYKRAALQAAKEKR